MNLLEMAKARNKKIQQMTMYNSGEIVKKAISGELTVEQIYEYDELFSLWSMGKFNIDDIRNHKGILYRCIQSHDSTGNPHWTPDITPALWVVIQLEQEDEIPQWVAGEIVETGDLRMYTATPGGVDKIYECIQGHTTQSGWEPPKLEALWKLVS